MPAAILAGQQIGPYLLVLRIGAGGMGDVYRARDTRLDHTVAVKVLSARLGGDARARFDREARAIAGLSHPNICAHGIWYSRKTLHLLDDEP